MRQFSANVRLSGSLYNEVTKSPLTIPEIICLRAIHGAEAVHGITEIAPVERSDADERDRIARIYGKAVAKRQEIVGGLGSLVGFAGPVPDAAQGVPPPASPKRGGGKKTADPEPAPAPVDEPELLEA